MNYAKQLPLDKTATPYPAPPNFPSTQAQAGVPIASSVITLSPNTTVIEMTVLGGQSGNSAIIGKWGTASVTTSNYDFIVGSGNTRVFVVPVSVAAGITSVQGANPANGLYPAVAVKTATAVSASVFSVEY